jgi:hypothetical protein
MNNQAWWKRIMSGEYKEYYKLLYGGREMVKESR